MDIISYKIIKFTLVDVPYLLNNINWDIETSVTQKGE